MIRTAVGGAAGRPKRNVCDFMLPSDDTELMRCAVSENGYGAGKELCPGMFAGCPGRILDAVGGTDAAAVSGEASLRGSTGLTRRTGRKDRKVHGMNEVLDI
ncbi:MAG: hypothetical protein LBJ20_06120 [Candidatus Methanoplasma sp.]|jgi:hypothetical protein|nr:hypothetical protein [Candidatus Methanoplasma sp.]